MKGGRPPLALRMEPCPGAPEGLCPGTPKGLCPCLSKQPTPLGTLPRPLPSLLGPLGVSTLLPGCVLLTRADQDGPPLALTARPFCGPHHAPVFMESAVACGCMFSSTTPGEPGMWVCTELAAAECM